MLRSNNFFMSVSKATFALGVIAILAAAGIIVAVAFPSFNGDQPETAFDLGECARALTSSRSKPLASRRKMNCSFCAKGRSCRMTPWSTHSLRGGT